MYMKTCFVHADLIPPTYCIIICILHWFPKYILCGPTYNMYMYMYISTVCRPNMYILKYQDFGLQLYLVYINLRKLMFYTIIFLQEYRLIPISLIFTEWHHQATQISRTIQYCLIICYIIFFLKCALICPCSNHSN